MSKYVRRGKALEFGSDELNVWIAVRVGAGRLRHTMSARRARLYADRLLYLARAIENRKADMPKALAGDKSEPKKPTPDEGSQL